MVRQGPLFCVAIAALLVFPAISAETAPVNLQTAEPFAVLAGSGITNTGSTTVIGDVGSHPTPDQTGFGPGADSVAITGTNQHDSAVTETAKDDLLTAYDDAAGRPDGTAIVGGELAGLTLTPGVYTDDDDPDSLALTGTLTLDGLGDPDSVFIFRSDSTMITASSSDVVLTNGAQACNIFWQVGSSATLGTGSHFEGTILAATSITLGHEASVKGRVLAQNGAVTMNTNTIENVPCEEPAPPPDPDPDPDPTSDPDPDPTSDPDPDPTSDPDPDPTSDPDPALAGPEWITGVAHANPPMNEIGWAPVDDATGYDLFRASEGGTPALLAQTDGAATMFKDVDVDVGTTYLYHVTAQVDGDRTGPSPVAEVTTIPVFTTFFGLAAAGILGIGAYAAIRYTRRSHR